MRRTGGNDENEEGSCGKKRILQKSNVNRGEYGTTEGDKRSKQRGLAKKEINTGVHTRSPLIKPRPVIGELHLNIFFCILVGRDVSCLDSVVWQSSVLKKKKKRGVKIDCKHSEPIKQTWGVNLWGKA